MLILLETKKGTEPFSLHRKDGKIFIKSDFLKTGNILYRIDDKGLIAPELNGLISLTVPPIYLNNLVIEALKPQAL
jgi:hypothetical protein